MALISLIIVGFGQPAWSWECGLAAGAFGYALFWRVLLCHENKGHRFWLATVWFTLVQLIQLSWFVSHPYLYSYSVYFVFAAAMGMQFGCLGFFITPNTLQRFTLLLFLSAFWTVLEWMRLFLLSGFSWNPVGIALTGSLYPLQMASLVGVYGLSFWVIFVNLLALRAYVFRGIVFWLLAAIIPYCYGILHVYVHTKNMEKLNHQQTVSVVLVQTAFPTEEIIAFSDFRQRIAFVIQEWRQILTVIKKQQGISIDLLVLPELVVPYNTYSFVYPYTVVQQAFKEVFGSDSLQSLPDLEPDLTQKVNISSENSQQSVLFVNNAFWVQSIANYFQTDVVIGLEDVEDNKMGSREYYSAAFYFKPNKTNDQKSPSPERYEKRVLVPMGEYIPFSFCAEIAKKYGIEGSFTCGKEAKVMTKGKVPFGISICYEETFGDLMRENRQLGANLLVNLTSDAWYPDSRLTWQHWDHARLRTVENGIPLVRACNTGITGAMDSLGRTVAVLEETSEKGGWLSDSIHINVPSYHYQTLYSIVGDRMIIGFSLVMILLGFCLGFFRIGCLT